MKHRQDDGVELTLVPAPNGEYDCVDIEIPDNVNTLILGEENMAINYRLRNVMKCFPNIEKFCILSSVVDIEVSNFMFPNVKHVESHNIHYLSGYNLIKTESVDTYREKRTFLNTFCAPDRTALDLGIFDVYYYEIVLSDYMLEGSFIEDIVWPKNARTKISKNSFGSCYAKLKPTETGIMKMGGIIIDFDKNTEEIIMTSDITSDNTKNICKDEELFVNKITISDISQLHLLPSKTSADLLYIRDMGAFGTLLSRWTNTRAKNIMVDPENQYYSDRDGVLYSKDRTSIVAFPKAREGHFSIPEGVIEIEPLAFSYTTISSVSFPDTLRFLGDSAFYLSEIEAINFGRGLAQIGGLESRGIFSWCKKLKKVEIPGSILTVGDNAFYECKSLEKVTLGNGIIEIGSNAFAGCESLKSLLIPSSVRSLRMNSFGFVGKIIAESNTIPKKFALSVFNECRNTSKEQLYNSSSVLLETPDGKSHIFPRMQSRESINEWNEKRYFSDIDPDDAPDMTCDDRMRQNLIIKMWNSFQSEEKRDEYGKSIRRIGKKICLRLIEEQKEDLLITFAGTGLLTKKTAQDVLEHLPDSMIEAKAKFLGIVAKEAKKRRTCL